MTGFSRHGKCYFFGGRMSSWIMYHYLNVIVARIHRLERALAPCPINHYQSGIKKLSVGLRFDRVHAKPGQTTIWHSRCSLNLDAEILICWECRGLQCPDIAGTYWRDPRLTRMSPAPAATSSCHRHLYINNVCLQGPQRVRNSGYQPCSFHVDLYA